MATATADGMCSKEAEGVEQEEAEEQEGWRRRLSVDVVAADADRAAGVDALLLAREEEERRREEGEGRGCKIPLPSRRQAVKQRPLRAQKDNIKRLFAVA